MASGTIGKFYSVSKGAIRKVAEHSGRADVVLAYLVLKRGQQKHDTNVTSWGRNAVADKLGVSRRNAMKLIDELRAIAWGPSIRETALVDAHVWNKETGENERVSPGHSGGGKGSNKVMPPCGDDFMYLPNSLTAQSPDKPYSPLGQLRHLPNKAARLHATLLLLGLYEHLDMQEFGGCDPNETIYIPWRYEGEARHEGAYAPMPLGYLGRGRDSQHYWIVDFRAADDEHWYQFLTRTHWKFIESITGETAADQEAPQFWQALWALRDLGLFYHAAMVFDSDPQNDPEAEVLYPLWVFNPAERKRLESQGSHEHGLARLTAARALRINLNEDLTDFLDGIFGSSDLIDEPAGSFLVAAPNMEARVLGIIRPRFIPNTHDSQVGWASLRNKAEHWSKIMKQKN